MYFNTMHESLMYSVYFAPRGKERLLALGHQIAQRYLSPSDKLIGLIGDAGAGKSLLINGMFPGLELSNDDQGMNTRPLPLLSGLDTGYFSGHTYHIDVRFELAFTQMHAIVESISRALDAGRRVVVEHFDLIYEQLGINAEMLIGVGEEVLVTRPNLFGPLPVDIATLVFSSVKYRRMAHTAEDITEMILRNEMKIDIPFEHSDVKHGFVLEFAINPEIDVAKLERRVKDYIDKNLPVQYLDEEHILIGEFERTPCTGPRIHVRNTSDIENFQILPQLKFNAISKKYDLVGLVGCAYPINQYDLNKLSL